MTALLRVAALVLLLVGIVLLPLRAVAATIPTIIAFDVALQSAATTYVETEPSLRPARGSATGYVYDGAPHRQDEGTKAHAADGPGAVHAYDDVLNFAFRREVGEVVVCDAAAPTPAAGAMIASDGLSERGAAVEETVEKAASGAVEGAHRRHRPGALQSEQREGCVQERHVTERCRCCSTGRTGRMRLARTRRYDSTDAEVAAEVGGAFGKFTTAEQGGGQFIIVRGGP